MMLLILRLRDLIGSEEVERWAIFFSGLGNEEKKRKGEKKEEREREGED